MTESDLQDLPAALGLLEDPRDGEDTEPLERGGGKIHNLGQSLSVGDPREGEETEHLEKGGGKASDLVSLLLVAGPRDGEDTEPLEEGDR
jgi:hypothetical protein